MYLSDDVQRYLRETGPTHTEVQAEMAEHAAEHDFPIIGPTAGGVLRAVARLRAARRVFEFGSGFGYSATWFLDGMAPDGEIILTEVDEDELELAERFLERAGLADRARFEHGDAMEIIESVDGEFDVVLIDHQKGRYADAFEAVRDRLSVGGAVIADNAFWGAIDYRDVLPYVERGEPLPDDGNARGIAEYLDTVRADDAFDTVVLPVDEGLALSTKSHA